MNRFDGTVLRKPKVGDANQGATSFPDVVVLDRNSTQSGPNDRQTYLDAFVDPAPDPEHAYAVLPAATGNVVEGSDPIQEEATPIDSTSFAFNARHFEVQVQSVQPTPQRVDPDAGMIYYDSPPNTQPVVVTYTREPLKVDYIRNDEVERFAYQSKRNRWFPRPGSSPHQMEEPLQKSGAFRLPQVEAVGPPRIVLGSPDGAIGTTLQTQKVPADQFESDFKGNPREVETTLGSGAAAVHQTSGAVQVAQSVIDQHEGQSIYTFRYDFYPIDHEENVLGATGDTLVMNPIPMDPIHNEPLRPLIRIQQGMYLEIAPTSHPQSDQFEAVWDKTTGRLTIQRDVPDGQPVYYDGVVMNREPIGSFGPTPLTPGEIQLTQQDFLGTTNVDPIDLSVYDRDGLIVYVEETGEMIADIQEVAKDRVASGNALDLIPFVDSSDEGFTPAYRLAPQQAEAFIDDQQRMHLQLSAEFKKNHEGHHLMVGTSDYYLENGVTFRLPPTSHDPANTRGVPDATYTQRLEDDVLLERVPFGEEARLPQTPIDDIGGYDRDVFFRRQDGSVFADLEPGEDVEYHFEDDHFKWLERTSETHVFREDKAVVQLEHRPVRPDNYSFLLNTGDGFKALDRREDVLIRMDRGHIEFVDRQGPTRIEGTGRIHRDQVIIQEPRHLDPPSAWSSIPDDPLEQPLAIIDDEHVARMTEQEAPDTYRLHQTPDVQGRGRDIRLIGPPETIFRHAWRPIDLSKRIVFPRRLRTLEPTHNPHDVPPGESFSLEGSDGATLTVQRLERVSLGTPVDDDGNPVTLTIPDYYHEQRHPQAQWTLYRGSFEMQRVNASPANVTEYAVNAQGELEFHPDVYDQFGATTIRFVPDFSASLNGIATEAEFRPRDRTLKLETSLEDPVTLKVLIPEDQYNQEPGTDTLFLERPLRSGTELIITYEYEDDNGDVQTTTEHASFRFRETIDLGDDQTSFSFGDQQVVDTHRSARVLRNGSIWSKASADVNQQEATIPHPVDDTRRIQVEYFVHNASGGERNLRLNHQPRRGEVVFQADQTEQTFEGDYRATLQSGQLLEADKHGFVIEDVQYDSGSDETTIRFQAAPLETLINPETRVTAEPVSERAPRSFQMDLNSRGEEVVRLFGDQQEDLAVRHILWIQGDPYRITDLRYDEDQNITQVEIGQRLLKEYNRPTFQLSRHPVYDPQPDILQANRPAILDQPYDLIRFDSQEDGTLFHPSDNDYTLRNSGNVVLDPSNIERPRAGDVWQLAYTGRRTVGPQMVQGERLLPLLSSTYYHTVNANQQNGLAGSKLKGRFTFRAPDSFFFRVASLEDVASDVLDRIRTNDETGQAGPIVTQARPDPDEQGQKTMIWQGGDTRDQDRVARGFLAFLQAHCREWENYLQIIDGRVIGSHDGRFRFQLNNDGQPGGEDPVTGELIPRYINPRGSGRPTSTEIEKINPKQQLPLVTNGIDDRLLITRTPYRVQLKGGSVEFEFQGTFKEAWEPSVLSRLYPKRSKVFTLTVPGRSNDPDTYKFFHDFGQPLADLRQDNVSVRSIFQRQAKAWLIEGEDQTPDKNGQVKLKVGMQLEPGDRVASNGSNGPDAKKGYPERYIPGFEDQHPKIQAGDTVSLGRVEFDDDGSYTKHIYGHNMEVKSVDAGTVTIQKHSKNGQFEQSDDPTQLVDKLQQNDTLFTNPYQYYLSGQDVMVDEAAGQLNNMKLPKFLANIIGQGVEGEDKHFPPPPKTYLDVNITYPNQRTEPVRFPALDGKPVNDDHDNPPPYTFPMDGAEIPSFEEEESSIRRVFRDTSEGIVVEGTVVDRHTIALDRDVNDPDQIPSKSPPDTFDTVYVEGVTDPADRNQSERFFVDSVTSNPNRLHLTAFPAKDSSVSYSILSPDYIHEGSGQRDPNDADRWNDIHTDFRRFSGGVTVYLNIQSSQYIIDQFYDESVVIQGASIAESSGDYTITIQSEGVVENNLYTLEDPNVDFSGVNDGANVTVDGADLNQVSLPVDYGENEKLYPHVLPESQVTSGAPGVEDGDEVTVAINSHPKLPVAWAPRFEGTGQVDPNNARIWQDSNTDFRDYRQLPTVYLHLIIEDGSGDIVENPTYRATGFKDGALQVASDIQHSGTLRYVLSTNRTYMQFGGKIDLNVHDHAILLDDSINPLERIRTESHHAITIPDPAVPGGSPANEGWYTIDEIRPQETINNTTFPPRIVLNETLRQDVAGYQLEWESWNTRRHSPELQDLQQTWATRRSIYWPNDDAPDDITPALGSPVDNPSTPAKSVLDQLETRSWDQVASGTEGQAQPPNEWTSPAQDLDFTQPDLSTEDPPDYLYIRSGPNRGFYPIDKIKDANTIQLASPQLPPSLGTPFLPLTASPEPTAFDILRPGQEFDRRTYELILYEQLGLYLITQRLEGGIRASRHDPDQLLQDEQWTQRPGDPSHNMLLFHINGQHKIRIPHGIEDRETWLTAHSPAQAEGMSLRQEIDAVLKGRERLYDRRFSWITYRTDLKNGTIQKKRHVNDKLENADERSQRNFIRNLG